MWVVAVWLVLFVFYYALLKIGDDCDDYKKQVKELVKKEKKQRKEEEQ